MDFEDVMVGIIFLVIAGIILFAVFPSLLASGSIVTQNSTYIKDFPATVTLLTVVPIIIVAIVIVFFVKFMKR